MLKNKKYQHNRQTKGRSKLWLIGGVVVLVVGAALLYFLTKDDETPVSTFDKTSTGHDVNLSPPTPEEQQAGNEAKEELTNKDGTPEPTTPSGTAKADPFITFVGQEGDTVEVTGYVGGVFEEGGTCKATFTKGSLTVTADSKGFQDASHTTCTPISVPRANFSQAGTWNVVLSYSSTKATGASQTRPVLVQ